MKSGYVAVLYQSNMYFLLDEQHPSPLKTMENFVILSNRQMKRQSGFSVHILAIEHGAWRRGCRKDQDCRQLPSPISPPRPTDLQAEEPITGRLYLCPSFSRVKRELCVQVQIQAYAA